MRGLWIVAAFLFGCGSGSGTSADVTWSSDVAPLLADRCGACHLDGGIGPFSVETYADAEPWGEAIVDSVQSDRMPPFFARETEECDMRMELQDDVRLSDDEKAMLADWVADGMPEGDPKEAAPAPLRQTDHLEDPDLILPLASEFTVDGDRDIYRCFRIEVPDDGNDHWITGVEVLPDNDLVVHHVLVWNDPDDLSAAKAGPDGSYACSGQPDLWPTELVAAWAPGSSPSIPPSGSGTLFHPGATLVVNVHYHPTGTTTETDRTAIAIDWTDEQPPNHATWYLVDLPFGAWVTPSDDGESDFRIPAGANHHVETLDLLIPDLVPWDLPVFAITPHMHYLGTEMLVTVQRPGQVDECLIHTPNFRFDFQTSYIYEPGNELLPVVHPGDTIQVRCTYDNSASNEFIDLQLDAAGIESPGDVTWGEETGDEMCMAMIGLLIPPVDWLELFATL